VTKEVGCAGPGMMADRFQKINEIKLEMSWAAKELWAESKLGWPEKIESAFEFLFSRFEFEFKV
jgi:hypothetical protein